MFLSPQNHWVLSYGYCSVVFSYLCILEYNINLSLGGEWGMWDVRSVLSAKDFKKCVFLCELILFVVIFSQRGYYFGID